MNLNRPEPCAEVRAAIPLLVGDDLEPEALEAARLHLASCRACTRALGAAQDARGALGRLRTQASAPDLWGPLQAALREEGLIRPPAGVPPIVQLPPIRPGPASVPRLGPRWALSAAAAALLAATLGLALQAWAPAPPADSPALPLALGPEAPPSTPSADRVPIDEPTSLAQGSGLRLVASGAPAAPAAPPALRPNPAGPGGFAALPAPNCPDPLAGREGPVALRPSTDQEPRPAVYFHPEGLWSEAIDLRQLRLHAQPLPGRPNGGVQAAGGQP